MFKKTISIFLVISIIVGLLCFNVNADEKNGLELVFGDDFEKYEVEEVITSGAGDFSKWTSVVKGDASPVSVKEEGGNKFLSLGRSADQKEAGGPRVEKLLPVSGNANIKVNCKVQTNGQTFQLSIRSADNSESTMVFNCSGDDVLSRTPGGIKLKSTDFVDFSFEINTFTMKYTSYINGKVYKRNQSLNQAIAVEDGIKIRFGTSVQPGKELYLDEVEIYSDDTGMMSGKLIDILSLKTDSSVLLTPYIKETHPKLYTDDFDKIREKIKTDKLAANWYESVKANADTLLKAEPEAYAPESDILTNVSRRIRARLYTLAFVYAIEEDDVYKERALEEIRNADNFPSWHPNNFLGVAELGGGVAVAYDWMYNGMTEEEREYVKSVILDNTLYLGALSYEGISDVFFVTATSNWNFVCNGGLVISALAISEDYPQLADYIFNKAAESIPYATEITFAPQGASPEGPGYWDYAAYNFVNMIAAIDSATIDGKKIPAKFDFTNTVGLSETLDFPVATHSSVGRFNYGDNVPAYGQSGIDLSIAYWIADHYNKPEYAKYQMQTRDLKGAFGSAWETTLKLMWYNPSLLADADAEFPLDKFYTHDNGPNLVTLRSAWENEIYVGMQGGLNGASHSFLSLGTFIVDALGERWATQIGQGNYRWDDYFGFDSKIRWTYYNCHTEGQNCVVLNPDKEPQQNVTALGKTIDSYSSADESYGVLDLSQAYDKSVNKYYRGAKLFDGKSKLVIQDDIYAKEPLESGYWFMHTDAKVFIDDDGKSALLVKNGKKMHLQIVSDFENAKFNYVDAKPLPTSQNPEIQQAEDYGKKLSIDLAGAKDIKLAVVFTPLDNGKTIGNSDFKLVSIDEWSKVKENTADNDAEILSDVISMYEGSPVAYKKGDIVSIDSSNSNIAPVVENGRTMVPLRFIAETLNAQVEWNNDENTVYIKNNLDELKFVIGEKAFYKNGVRFEADASAYVFEGRTFVPVRTVAEAFGKNVGWKDGLVTISKFGGVENNGDVVKTLTEKLVYTLTVNGNKVPFFDVNKDLCEVYVSPAANYGIEFVSCKKDDAISVVQPDGNGLGSVTVNGKKTDIKLISDPYFYASGDMGLAKLDVYDLDFKDMTGVVTWIQPESVVASLEGAGAVSGIHDNSMDTFWSSQGTSTVDYDLGEVKRVTSMSLANDYKNGKRRYVFDLQYSTDGVNWRNLLTDAMTSGTTMYPEIYDFDDVDARYIRLVAKGNTTNNWNIFYELRLYESVEQQEADRANWNDYFAAVDWNSFRVGDKLSIGINGVCNNGYEYKFAENEIVSCVSDNESVVKFNGNVLEATGSGKAKITITVNYHGIHEYREIEVTVTE